MLADVQSQVALNFALFLQLIGLLGAIILDKYIEKKNRMKLQYVVILIASLLVIGQLEAYCGYYDNLVTLRLLTSIYCYIIRPVIIVVFINIIKDDRKPWIFVIINALVYLSALFSNVAFTITPDNNFVRGPLGYSCHVISAVLLIWNAVIAIQAYKKYKKFINCIPIFITIIVIFGTALDSTVDYDEPISFLMVSIVSASLFYYIYLHIMFIKEHEEALEAQKRIEIMMSQIQPHFMYNTLSTIQALCLTDPKKAFTTAEKFGTYLRKNIGSLNIKELIPFKEELEHTKVYADIEIIRFPHIHLEYNIEDEDFMLPALSLQPLVENAIRHGVRIRKEGCIIISSKLVDGFHELTVCDNGRGFDVEKANSDEKGHIGIKTLKDRLQTMCGGSLEIESIIDAGTKVIIKIPVGEKVDETDMR